MLVKVYITLCALQTLFWFIYLYSNHKKILLFSKEYLYFISIKWKLLLFFTALGLLCLISYISKDPTWDIPETLIMSLLTFYTSPFSIGTIYRNLFWIQSNYIELYLSVILLFFSSAWFYDGYVYFILLWNYPETAFSNLFLSPFFYLLWGILWNLGYSKKDWVVLLFSRKEWIDFYSAVSFSIDNDDHFVLLMKCAWNLD